MPTITLTLPIAGEVITADLHADNYQAIMDLLNGGLDSTNLPTLVTTATRDVGEIHWSSSTYADPDISGTTGPSITGLLPGRYVIDFGLNLEAETGNALYVNILVNGSTTGGNQDDNAIESQVDQMAPGATSFLADLDQESNTLKMVYRASGGTGNSGRRRWIKATKYAELE